MGWEIGRSKVFKGHIERAYDKRNKDGYNMIFVQFNGYFESAAHMEFYNIEGKILRYDAYDNVSEFISKEQLYIQKNLKDINFKYYNLNAGKDII